MGVSANTLRIGNYCYCQDEINVIYGITKEGFIQYEKENSVYYCGIDEIKPIELTEEILFKCGFNKKQDYINGVGLCIFFEHKEFNYRLNQSFEVVLLKIKLNNLHQLQNLYFALTGEELEIKL